MIFQKKPAPILYLITSTVIFIHTKIFHHLKCYGTKVKGPALLLANHASFEDWKFIVSSQWGRRITFLCTYHFFTFKILSFFLKRIGAIPKLQFTSDLTSMKKIKYVTQHGGTVYIAPEGTVYANGKLGYISPAIAKMVKFLGVPVYASKIQGAGLGSAKWTKRLHKDHVSINTQLIISKEDTKLLDLGEIYSRIVNSLQYNEFDYQKKNNITCKDNDIAEGFETMFYKCPCCKNEFSISTSGKTIKCSHCGAEATLKDNFNFKWNTNTQYFSNYIQWYDWQLDTLKKEIKNPDFKLEDEVEYGIDKPGVNNYIKVGEGKLSLSLSGWDYKGTFDGKYIEEHDDLKEVFLATLKCGVHFELPYKNGHCRVYYPKNGNTAMKWHLASLVISLSLVER